HRDAGVERLRDLGGRRPTALTVALATGDRTLAGLAQPGRGRAVGRKLQRPYAAGALAVAAAVRDRDAVAAGVDRLGIRRSAAEAVAGAAGDLDIAARTRPGVDQLPAAAGTLPVAAAGGCLPAVAVRAAAVSGAAVHLRQTRARPGTGFGEADAAAT